MASGDRLYSVEVDEKHGYINSSGEIVIDPIFDWAFGFTGGLAQVAEFDSSGDTDPLTGLRSMRIGFIDSSGEFVVPFKYRCARDFSEGRAAVMLEEEWGFIDSSGGEVISPQFDAAYYFAEGIAPVEIGDTRKLVIDLSGNVLFELNASALGQCSNGLIPCELSEGNGKWSFHRKTGEVAFEISCDAVSGFSEGLAAVLERDKNGYINTNGEWAIPPQFAQASNFQEGLATVEVPRTTDGKVDYSKPQTFGFVDLDGNMAIEPKFQYAGDFSEGLAVVCINETLGFNTEYSYIDKTGEVVIPPIKAHHAEPFCGQLACIQDIDDYSFWYINRQGDFVWPN